MSMGNRPLDDVTQDDLQMLIDNQVSERKIIEYKECLPGNSDKDKREFLADVSSFANAGGGHLLYGICEEGGVPVKVVGLSDSNLDQEKLRLENMLRDCVDPRIPGLGMHVPPPSGRLLVIRIPRSWSGPHVVKHGNHWRFYSRNSAGKYPLDVDELRSAFLLSETVVDRIRDFRTRRLGLIVSGETPVMLEQNPKMVLHIVPFGTASSRRELDLYSLLAHERRHLLAPIGGTGDYYRYNLDGIMTYARSSPSSVASSYAQVFRDGTIEAVDAYTVRERQGQRIIPSMSYEQHVLKGVRRFLSAQKHLDAELPVFLMLSLLGVAGYKMGVDQRLDPFSEMNHVIDRDTLIIPEVQVDSYDDPPERIMRPAFDTVWNAAGWDRSRNYGETGRWVGQR